MTPRPPPTLAGPPCQKCGSVKGWKGPTYRGTRYSVGGGDYIMGGEGLLFTCRTCGYERREPTKDAPPKRRAADKTPSVILYQSVDMSAPWWAFWR